MSLKIFKKLNPFRELEPEFRNLLESQLSDVGILYSLPPLNQIRVKYK